jgi:hypothetical protein
VRWRLPGRRKKSGGRYFARDVDHFSAAANARGELVMPIELIDIELRRVDDPSQTSPSDDRRRLRSAN